MTTIGHGIGHGARCAGPARAASNATRQGWIKRRARRIQRFYGVARKLAVYDARIDYLAFIGWQR